MAALGKIRSYGTFLIIIIGLGLFGFIGGDMFRSCETTGRMSSTRVGQVLGENIGVEDYQNYQTEFVECTKMGNPQADEDQLRQQAWQSFVQNKIIENEANELGLTVTNEEVKNLMNQGSPLLSELANSTGLVNEQTGRFDKAKYDQFNNDYSTQVKANPQLAEYYDKMNKFLQFKVKQFKEQLLARKSQSLLQNAILSNPVEAKFAFDGEKQESDIQLAYLDYNSVNDKDVKVSDADLKAKYEEMKQTFKSPEEVRAIKYILVKKVASKADRDALTNALVKCANQLKEGAEPEKVVREGQSTIAYLGVPVTRKAFSADIANRIDSMAVGAVIGPVESQMDNTMNVVKLLAKNTLPDSVEYRVIQVAGKDNAETLTKADSVYKALTAGGDFEAIAKNYGQTGEKSWLTTSQYERATSMSKDNALVFNALNNMAVNEVKNIPLAQGSLVVQVTDRKAMTTKYDVAVIKRDITYSNATSDEISNKFNQFVAGHQTLEAMEKDAAKSGYQVLESKRVTTSQGLIPGIANSRDALKWVFEADKNEMSAVMNCGASRDELIVMVLTDIYPKGFMSIDNPEVKDMVQQEAMRDKKAEMLIAKLKDVKSIDAAKAKGAKVVEDGVKQITFASPVFITAIQASEPALSGAVAATEKGKFSSKPVKGNSAVYVFSVDDRRTTEGKFDAKEYAGRTSQMDAQNVLQTVFMDLYYNAEVKDNRYLFF